MWFLFMYVYTNGNKVLTYQKGLGNVLDVDILGQTLTGFGRYTLVLTNGVSGDSKHLLVECGANYNRQCSIYHFNT